MKLQPRCFTLDAPAAFSTLLRVDTSETGREGQAPLFRITFSTLLRVDTSETAMASSARRRWFCLSVPYCGSIPVKLAGDQELTPVGPTLSVPYCGSIPVKLHPSTVCKWANNFQYPTAGRYQ